MTDTLHIYGQLAEHSTVYIAGGRVSLIRLREAINLALEKEEYDQEPMQIMDFFVNDGEGYSVKVYCLPNDEMDKLSVPYTWEFAQDNRNYFPWNIKLNS